DNDDRLTTAADVNISTVRLVTDLEVAEKQKLLDDADRFLAEAIAVREQNGYPVFIQKTHRLNGYLFDLLMSPKGRRVSNREQRAMTLMSQLATEPIEGAGDDAISHTIPATSYRTRVHWHCMCAMVHRLAEHPEMAMSHIQHALHTAEDHLPRNDDRRHRAVLIYVQFRGPELLSGISKNGQADPSLVRELRSHLDTIIEPNAHFRKEKQGYVRDLDRMSK
ncbi:MAG: serine/threonine protein kinase, partial [Rhodopirellula sp. JB053]